MATGGLYGTSTANSVVATSGAESTGLYGNATQFGGSYFEWFIFQVSDTQPATPTGGSWSFTTNSGTPPAGWSSNPPTAPTNTVWVSIAIVNSKNATSLTWSVPGKFSFSSGLPILSGSGSPLPGDGQSDQLYIQLNTTPQTIWFKESGTWTRLTGSSLYADLTSNQTIAGIKTFSSPIVGSVTGTAANVTGIVAVLNGGTGVTTSTGTGSVVLNTSPLLNTPILSGATVDSTAPYLNFTPTAAPTYLEGRLFYDSTAKTLTYYNDNSQMSLNIGQENVVRVRNQTGATITEGSVVYVNGATGNTPTVSLAIATSFSTADIIGVATTTMANNEFGYATTAGLVNGLDTSAFSEGQAVFVSATTPGAFTATEPVAPNYSVQVGVILRSNPSVGTLLVSLQMISTEVSHLVGTVLISQGGTGQTTANAAFNALAPSQTGNTGKYLTTDGSNTSWATNPLGTVTSVAATVPGFLSISGSPITTSGTLAIDYSGTALPVLNGGTGTTTSTGTGSVVLSASPTLTGTVNVAGLTASNSVTLSGGTANGVTYLNGSKVLTSGSALTFDGTNMGVGTSPTSFGASYTVLDVFNATNGGYLLVRNSAVTGQFAADPANVLAIATRTNHPITFEINSSEQMRLTSTGLGIGTSSPGAKLHVDSGSTGLIGIVNSTNANGGYITGQSSGSAIWDFGSAKQVVNTGGASDVALSSRSGFLALGTGNTERMRLDTSGNLGIGTSSPVSALTLANAKGLTWPNASGVFSGTAGSQIVKGNDNNLYFDGYDGAMVFRRASFAESMRLDSSGNLGLGVTPSAWNATNIKALQISNGGFANNGGSGFITNNAFYTGSYVPTYIATNPAQMISFNRAGGNDIQFLIAPSGTAGNAITFTQAMTLDASGNLLVGTSTARSRITALGTTATNPTLGTATGTALFCPNDNAYGTMFGSANTGDGWIQQQRVDGTATAYNLILQPSGGNLLVGTTNSIVNSNARLHVVGTEGIRGQATASGGTASIGAFGTSTGATYYYIGYDMTAGSIKYQVLFNGNVQNTNNSYGAISDIKLKENIVDASPKLVNLMQVKVRNYNLIGDTTKQIGVVAQELETVFPSMIEETVDYDLEGNDLGTTTKAVKYSVFVPMLIKAMQEQQALIQSLQAQLTSVSEDVAALKAAA